MFILGDKKLAYFVYIIITIVLSNLDQLFKDERCVVSIIQPICFEELSIEQKNVFVSCNGLLLKLITSNVQNRGIENMVSLTVKETFQVECTLKVRTSGTDQLVNFSLGHDKILFRLYSSFGCIIAFAKLF